MPDFKKGLNALFGTLLAGMFFVAGSPAAFAAPLKVVASSTMYADLVKKVGGDKVEIKAVASPKFNVHFYQPKPSDVRNVANADLYVNWGLDIEAWSDPLLEAAGKPALFRGGPGNVDLSQGIPLLKIPEGSLSRSMGDLHVFGNPHYQMNPENAKTMVKTILAKLKEADPANASFYEENARAFLSRLDAKIQEWRKLCAHCTGKEVISYHEDIDYFADFLGFKVEQYLEPKPGIPPTPKHLEFLENYVKEKGITAIVMPTYYTKAAADALAGRIGGKVVTICQNAGEIPGTEDFFGFFDSNVRQISEALK